MQQGKKSAFGETGSSAHLIKLDYMKVRIVYHCPDKSTKSVTYKCCAGQTLLRIAACLKITHKLKQNESIFIYLQRRILDQNKTLSQIRTAEGSSELLVLDAATSDVF